MLSSLLSPLFPLSPVVIPLHFTTSSICPPLLAPTSRSLHLLPSFPSSSLLFSHMRPSAICLFLLISSPSPENQFLPRAWSTPPFCSHTHMHTHTHTDSLIHTLFFKANKNMNHTNSHTHTSLHPHTHRPVGVVRRLGLTFSPIPVIRETDIQTSPALRTLRPNLNPTPNPLPHTYRHTHVHAHVYLNFFYVSILPFYPSTFIYKAFKQPFVAAGLILPQLNQQNCGH